MSRIIGALHSAGHLIRYLTTFPADLACGDEAPGDVFDRYHTADYVTVSDGLSLDRQKLIDHAASAKRRVRSVTVDVHDAIVNGDRVAARYVLTAEMRKGNRIVTEIHMFGRTVADGRLKHVDQLTRTIKS